MATKVGSIEPALERLISSQVAPPLLTEAMRHSVMGGGKRLRPVLTLTSAEVMGGEENAALPAALAVELVHNFSLVHDDLPCMDDDDWRRGRPTCHKVYGEAIALLAGDALLCLAFQVLADSAPTVSRRRVARALAELAQAAGPAGMTGGQVLDLAGKASLPGVEGLRQLHAMNTGALITAAVRLGGIMAGAGKKHMDILTCYGRNLGLTFQIVDDLLDVGGGKDEASYPALFGCDASWGMARKATEAALAYLEPLGGQARPLRALAEAMLERRK